MSDTAPNLLIQPAAGDDELRACAALMAASEPWITLNRDFNHSLNLLSTSGCEVYVAKMGDEVAGLVAIDMQGPFAGYLRVVAVAAQQRGRHIGSELVRYAEKRIFRDSPNVFLCVSDFNPRAQKFYARLGYERIGELKDYVIKGASEILMRKTIGPKSLLIPQK